MAVLSFPFGPCRQRSSSLEQLDLPQTEDSTAQSIFDFYERVQRWTGGQSAIIQALDAFSRSWPSGKTIKILEFSCGRGDGTQLLLRWAKKRKRDISLFSVDSSGRFIQWARERLIGHKNLALDIKDWRDPLFLQAQQADYVVSFMGMHRLPTEQIVPFLKKSNLLAKRGILLTDWVRDLRGYMAMNFWSGFYSDPRIQQEAQEAVKRSFTIREMRGFITEAELDYLGLSDGWGYRMTVAAERVLNFNPELNLGVIPA